MPELKIKIKSLAAEAAIIRAEERKHTGATRASLHHHRTIDVRREARASFLAYGFLRGKALNIIERPNSRKPDWDNVKRIARKFGGPSFDEPVFKGWAEIDQPTQKVTLAVT